MDIDHYRQILKQYWGYTSFRPLQEDIIMSVAGGKDTLGLMPTGGGKSITYQVPALAHEGICLVITPLIALMKDQVMRLNAMGIRSLSVHAGMSSEEIDITLENAIYGNYKFLYVSPERISTRNFLGKLNRFNLSLVTIDEAHCISQWGYDFRPAYLKIAMIRNYIPDTVPFLALTATATPPVIDDILDRLEFRERNVLRTSYNRKNITYLVRKVEDKSTYLVDTLEKVKGSGIVYVRSRKKCSEIAELLSAKGIGCDFYHAGLTDEVRDKKQAAWTENKVRVIAATNAFGMGIDKPDVRFVIHWDLPDSIESYFQESGRAGRDGKPATAVLLFSPADKSRLLDSVRKKFPPVEKIKDTYDAICNYLQVPVGSGKDCVYDFNMAAFVSKYRLPVIETYNSLQFLQREGYMEFTEEINNPSRVHFIAGRDDLYKFQVANEKFDSFIKLLLRSYTGMFTEFVPVNEEDLSRKSGATRDTIYQFLVKLSALNIIRYIPGRKTAMVIFKEERLMRKALHISPENYLHVKERYTARIDKMADYAVSSDRCRSSILLSYFGESSEDCGKCDVCRSAKEKDLTAKEMDTISEEIRSMLKENNLFPDEIVRASLHTEEKVIKIIRWMLDRNILVRDRDNRLKCKE